MRTRRKMSNPHFSHELLVCLPAILLTAIVEMLLPTQTLRAEGDQPDIVRVEEDWELAIATPDPEANAPQVVCVFGPEDPEHDTHAVFELNHCTMPDFAAGGLQLQCWWHDYLFSYRNSPDYSQFEAAIDEVTFTTVTEVSNGKLKLAIINGHSLTWGNFGGDEHLRISLNTWRNHLNQYNANHSVEHTRVSFGANRVNRLVRREVRYYSTDGLVSTDTEDKYVHRLVIDLPPN